MEGGGEERELPSACVVCVAGEFMWRSEWKQVRIEGRFGPTSGVSADPFCVPIRNLGGWGVCVGLPRVGVGRGGEPGTSLGSLRVRKVCMGAG